MQLIDTLFSRKNKFYHRRAKRRCFGDSPRPLLRLIVCGFRLKTNWVSGSTGIGGGMDLERLRNCPIRSLVRRQ